MRFLEHNCVQGNQKSTSCECIMKICVKQLIIKECEDKIGLDVKLAEMAGFPTPMSFITFLQDDQQELEDLNGLIRIVRYLFPNAEFEIMTLYALHVNPNKQTARYMLEYLDANKIENEKKQLIEKMLTCSNNESRDWARLYQYDDMVCNKQIDHIDALMVFSKSKTSIETEMIATIFSSYIYLDQQIYDHAFYIIKSLMKNIVHIENSYIREMYRARIEMLKAEYLTRIGDLEEARECCSNIVNSTENNSLKAWACLHVGNTYLLTDYKRSKEYLNKGISYSYINYRVKKNIKRSLNFLENYWGNEPPYLNFESEEPSDRHEVIYYYINNDQIVKGFQLLHKLPIDCYTPNELAFYYYLKGLVTNNMNDYIESAKNFKKCGDIYFRQLPLQKLQEFGIQDSIIRLLAE